MYQIVALLSVATAIVLLWRTLRVIIDRIERVEEVATQLTERVSLIEVSTIAFASKLDREDEGVCSSSASSNSGDETGVAPMVTEVIHIIDDIDEDAKQLRRALRKKGLPARGTIEEMRERLENEANNEIQPCD